MKPVCIIEGCNRPAHRSPMCAGHEYRRKHGLPMDTPLAPRGQTPLEMVKEAVAALFEVDPLDKEEYDKRWARFRVATRRWVLAPKPTDPRGKGGERTN